MQTRLLQMQTNLAMLGQDVETSLKEAQTLHASAQSIALDVARRHDQVVADLRAVEERSAKLEEFKTHLLTREQVVARSQGELGALAQQREALQAELVGLKRQTMDEVAKGERLVREREAALARREEDVAATNLLLHERQRNLHESERGLEEREQTLARQKEALDASRAEVEARDRRIREMQAGVEALQAQRDELNRLVSALSAKL